MKSIIACALLAFVASATCGNVQYDRCGGVGTPVALRIEGCEGPVCWMTPGTPYYNECDFYPSGAAPSLSLKVTAQYLGTTILIIETVIPNSGVQPGFIYTVKFTIVPNDILSGEYLPIEASIYHTTPNPITDICLGFHVRVEELSA